MTLLFGIILSTTLNMEHRKQRQKTGGIREKIKNNVKDDRKVWKGTRNYRA